MKIVLQLLLFNFILISSCSKDVAIPTGTNSKTKISIGNPDPNVKITDINPDTIISSFALQTNYSIDVNSDGLDDFNLSVRNDYIYMEV